MRHTKSKWAYGFTGVLLLIAFVAGGAWIAPTFGRSDDEKDDKEKRPARQTNKAPKVGDVAPLFTLKSPDGEREVSLAGFRGKRPVVLFFGSYT